MTKRFWLVVVVVWFVGVAAAFAAVWQYKMTPGPYRSAPTMWPRTSAIRQGNGVADIVMFVHPQCPCSRASMTELERLASFVGDSAQIHVVIVESADAPASFFDGPIWERANAIPRVDLVVDRGELEAKRFAAVTSGATRVYSSDGALVFEGGMTVARGHEGGAVAERIRRLLIDDQRAESATPIFGCALATKETEQ